MNTADYAAKLERMAPGTLLVTLEKTVGQFVRRVATDYQFTFQELRRVAQAARDLEMWCEEPLPLWWQRTESAVGGADRTRKKALLRLLEDHLESLAGREKVYPESALAGPPRRPVRLEKRRSTGHILGRCPAFSERTVCCGLHSLDAVRGCPFSCSYCTIQTFYGDTAELEEDLSGKLSDIDLDPTRRYHIGTGQASDSLVWGNREHIFDSLLEFAAQHPNVLLELKTKSDQVTRLLERAIPGNVVCSWSLNTPTMIRNEEHGTASLERRLEAARSVADRGVPVAFHFHPMIYYRNWDRDYPRLAERLQARFDPPEVAFVSMGSVTLIKPVVQEIRRRGGETKILQMEMVRDPHGKLTYSDRVKLRLYRRLFRSFRPWRDDVFFYLCMETEKIWQQALGWSFSSNEIFEREFLNRCLPNVVEARPGDGLARRSRRVPARAEAPDARPTPPPG